MFTYLLYNINLSRLAQLIQALLKDAKHFLVLTHFSSVSRIFHVSSFFSQTECFILISFFGRYSVLLAGNAGTYFVKNALLLTYVIDEYKH